MNGIRYFVDSNVLLCPYDELSPVRRDHFKLRLAWLWENRRGAVIWQLLITLVEHAWHWMDKAQLRFWDGLIVAAAERTRCRYLLSEDFQEGRESGSVTILNPFKTSPPSS